MPWLAPVNIVLFYCLLSYSCVHSSQSSSDVQLTTPSHLIPPLPSDDNSQSDQSRSGLPNSESQIYSRVLCPPLFYKCDELPAYCLYCSFNHTCTYGSPMNVSCEPAMGVLCRLTNQPSSQNDNLPKSPTTTTPPQTVRLGARGNYSTTKEVICRYCHQLTDMEVTCLGRTHCHQSQVPRSYYETFCEPHPNILCLGTRLFPRMIPCNWSGGKSYITTVLLSLFLGGFGVDRFYLGMWAEGLGKLLSFGGLGVWTVVDFVLILSGYVKPPGDAVYW